MPRKRTKAAAAAEPIQSIELRTLEVTPGENLAGHTLRMRYPSAGFLIAQRRGTATDADYWAEVLDAIVEHDLDVDPARLPGREVNLIGLAWTQALREAAVPPA